MAECRFKWKRWPDKKCTEPTTGDEDGNEHYCPEHLRIMLNRRWREGAKKSVSEKQKRYYKYYWSQNK